MATVASTSAMVFFLGGNDAEMNAIREVLHSANLAYCDKQLGWGASTSAYAEEIAAAAANGKTAVLIELKLDSELPEGAIVVDHHNENSGRPASILQVLNLLGLKPTRWQQLIAANDSAYIPGMLALGATKEEINAVRETERVAQGITPEQEAEAVRAIGCREVINGVTVVRMNHNKTAPVCDRLFDPQVKQNQLILSDGEINFFGAVSLCKELAEKFGGWFGWGNLDGTGFWGSDHTDASWKRLPNWRELLEEEMLFILEKNK